LRQNESRIPERLENLKQLPAVPEYPVAGADSGSIIPLFPHVNCFSTASRPSTPLYQVVSQPDIATYCFLTNFALRQDREKLRHDAAFFSFFLKFRQLTGNLGLTPS